MFGSQRSRILRLPKGNGTMMVLLWIAAVTAGSQAQSDCSQGACYPPSGDLLLGRGHLLRASSTCGLAGSEVYCTPYQQRRMKCCPCDSRNPGGPLAHTVRDVLSTSGPERWWQSRKEVSPVTLEADLENLFQLDQLLLSFKGPRPSEFVIERTSDRGQTWQPALYFATDCARAFPQVPTSTPLSLDQTYCYTLPPTDNNPYQDHTIQFSPLRQYAYVSEPNSRKIEKLSGLTGLRLRLTGLGQVPRMPGRALSRFYALKEMRVLGSCLCHGHASRCLPPAGGAHSNALVKGVEVSPQCDCQHHTAGVNCERCDDLYNDLPWRPAEEGDPHSCQRCECNNHAQRCHFDQAVFEASGWRSGGVCEQCQHHTAGPRCDRCAPGYQPNPRSRMDRPDACIRCVCSPEGSKDGGGCEGPDDSCRCKANVEGPRCDRCRRGHYGLSASNPLGCAECSCSADGSLSYECDPVTGQCPCRAHFHGRTCQLCSRGHWKPPVPGAQCQPCNCDPTRSYGDTCDQVTGQCQCRPNFGGRTCSQCPDNTFGDPLLGCWPCRCDPEGTLPGGCDKQTGACQCRPGVSGQGCDSCARGHCDSFPACQSCPSCFFGLDAQRQNMSLALRRFSPSRPPTPSQPGGELGPRFRALESRIRDLRDSISLPPRTALELQQRLSQLEQLRDQMNKLQEDVSPLTRTPGLDSELDRLQELLDRLTVDYRAARNSSTPDTGALSAIKDAYNDSNAAAQRANASEATVDQSANIRKEIKKEKKVQSANSQDLKGLDRDMGSGPDLAPLAREACGSVLDEPCTPQRCDAERLCPPEGTPACEQGQKCVGALPLAKKADSDAEGVKDRLDKLAKKITDAAEKLEEAQDTTNQVRTSAEKLSNRMKKTRDELDEDLKEARDVIKGLKEFLSDPSSNLSHIQNVSEWILGAEPPLNLEALRKKLEQLKDLAANLPNSTAVLAQAAPQLDAARELLDQAQDARDQALGVKASVDDLLTGLGPEENSLSNLEDSLQDALDDKDTVEDRLDKLRKELQPTEKALDDAAELAGPLKPQLDDLRALLQDGTDQARVAQDKADEALNKAEDADKDLQDLEKQLNLLKDKAPPGGGGDDGSLGDRLERLQQDAGVLANTTNNMLKSLGGKADSIRSLQEEILQKSEQLKGLDVALQDRLAKLRKKAHDLSNCVG